MSTSLKIPAEYQDTFLRVARGELPLARLPSPERFTDHSPPADPAGDYPDPCFLVQRTPLVGRESELATLNRLLADPECRLLTLTGQGGIGKTRLAIEFAITNPTLFPGGIYFTRLASLRSPDFIVLAIGEALKLSFSGSSDPREQLLRQLSGRQRQALLLILDDMEHLLASSSDDDWNGKVTTLLLDMLLRAPLLKILVTSRERIHLQAEWSFELHGLLVQEQQHAGQPEDNSAAALFLQNARRVDTGFQVSPQDYPALIRICQLTGGIPLAIELAAAWTGVLSCREIAQEIQSNLDFLSTMMRDIPERHRSLRATFEHSWKLLTEEERAVLCRLSVFQGGFLRQAAEQVVGADLNLLGSLVFKSLVRRTESGRYDLHTVVRQFALAHLRDDPLCDTTRQRHSDYYLHLLAEKENTLKGAGQSQAIQELVVEMDNVRAAWA